MQKKFCRNCGQENIPQVSICAKCGAKFPVEKTSRTTNPFDMPHPPRKDEPPPTIAVNADSFKIPIPNQPKVNPPNAKQPPQEEKSKKMFWIIGGVGAVLVLLLGVFAIVGIGGFIYFNTTSDQETARDYPVDENSEKETTDDENNEDKKDEKSEKEKDEKVDKKINLPKISNDGDKKQTSGKYTSDQLISFIEDNKKRVGKYKLNSVQAVDKEDYFPNKDAGINALYENGSKRVLHNISMYSDIEKAKADFENYVELIEKTNTKNLSNSKESLVYKLEGFFFLVFCNDGGGCHQIVAKTDDVAMEYFNSYFKK